MRVGSVPSQQSASSSSVFGASGSGASMDLSEAVHSEMARTREKLEAAEALARARRMILPTNDGLVKERLRELGEPAILFGEGAADVRLRGRVRRSFARTRRPPANDVFVLAWRSDASV